MSSVDETINNFVSCAERFYGVREGTSQHSIILALYNSSKPADEYQMKTTDPWCAAFVGAIAAGCGLGDIIPISASCKRMQEKFQSLGGKAVTSPSVGCIAFFDWNGDGHNDEHVGIVVKVNGSSVKTIEGNKSDKVDYRDFNVSDAKYIQPNWSRTKESEQVQWTEFREFYQELTWSEKQEIKTFPTLKIGDSGIYVKILQDFLGFYPDGIFNEDVDNSLRVYQKKMQLEVDGICGRQTWSSFFA